jgi:hypothetical protein
MTDEAATEAILEHLGKKSLLQEADDLINGPRQEAYDDPKRNHQRIAVLWSVILGKEVTYQQVIQCMIAVKLARLIHSPDHLDSWKDIAGYAGVWDLAHNDVGGVVV